jgi:hypothetical protein
MELMSSGDIQRDGRGELAARPTLLPHFVGRKEAAEIVPIHDVKQRSPNEAILRI